MIISKIQIENFRSIKEQITINSNNSRFKTFVGPNNVGKSNVLRAINLFFNKFTEGSKRFDPLVDICKSTLNTKIHVELTFTNDQDEKFINYLNREYNGYFNDYTVPITLRYFKNGNSQYSFTNSRGQKITLDDLLEKILSYVNCTYIPAIKDYNEIINSELMKKIIPIIFQGWGVGTSNILEMTRNKNRFNQSITGLEGILESSGVYISGIMNSIVSNITDVKLKLPYKDLEEFLGKINIQLSEEYFSDIELQHQGSGVQSAIIYSLLKLLHEITPKYSNSLKNREYIWLIEEPETFLHNDLQRKIFRKLKEYSTEGHIYITTHSPVFIDKVDYSNTYHVTKNDKTELNKVNAKSILSVIGGSLGVAFDDVFLFKDYNFLVEGETDKNILTKINELMIQHNVAGNYDPEKVELIVCKSANSIPIFYNMYNVFNQYADFYALFDRDDAGIKARTDLINNHINADKLLLIPQSNFKEKNEIEDLVEKKIWDEFLQILDAEGLVSLEVRQGDIVDYKFENRQRVDVKKRFAELIVEKATEDISKFPLLIQLIRSINDLCND